ncbi:MAG: hypothetical protein NVS3B20_05740 [Polyangiales bacterium]
MVSEGDSAREKLVAEARARVGSTVRRRWHLDELLGVGGMAAVFAATPVNKRQVALKIMHREFANDPRLKKMFFLEGEIPSRIEHDGRVNVLFRDVTDEGEPCLVVELLHGGNFEAVWRQRRRPLRIVDLLHVVSRILDFLVACHDCGIVHRDINPANVFLTRDGRVKLLDFGVARDLSDLHAQVSGIAVGTIGYMPPEQATGCSDTADHRSDLFSVGAILFAVLSGRTLCEGVPSEEALRMIASVSPPSLSDVAPSIPAEICRLVDKALAMDRNRRFKSASEMLVEVDNALTLLTFAKPTLESSRIAVSALLERGGSTPPHMENGPTDLLCVPPPLIGHETETTLPNRAR